MRLFRYSLALFFFFVAVFGGVRHLDKESRLYDKCVNDLAMKTAGSSLNARQQEALLKKLKTPYSQFFVGDEVCPALLKRHRLIFTEQLENQMQDYQLASIGEDLH